jgi:5-amino-6-(5-phospho-D-ribitylamino)uracil phosphatase
VVLKPKAIFLDIDGTILNHYNKVSIHTKEIIDDFRNQGIYVFIATGRSAEEIEEILPHNFNTKNLHEFFKEKKLFVH